MSNPKYERIGSIEVRATEEAVEVAQECLKVVKTLCKIQRFGIFDAEPGQDKPNWERLKEEIADLLARLEELHEIIDAIEQKEEA